MTVSSEVPASYRTRWNPFAIQAAQSPASAHFASASALGTQSETSKRKLNTSCLGCRNSRVKCSGGQPCKRCTERLTPSTCEYGVSRRRGKRKASVSDSDSSTSLSAGRTPHAGGHSQSALPGHGSFFDGTLPLNLESQFGQFPNSFDFSTNFTPVQSTIPGPNPGVQANSPSLTDFLDSLAPLELPPGPIREDASGCLDSCFTSVRSMTKELLSLRNAVNETSFDKVLRVLNESITHAARYFGCENCDAGCPRLMTLSLLHQRQVDIISDVAKDPRLCLSVETPPITFGEYIASAEDGIAFTRIVLLRVLRDMGLALDNFHDRAKGFEHRYHSGDLILGEAGKLNLKWLFGTAASLKKRVDCLRMILEKPDWGTYH